MERIMQKELKTLNERIADRIGKELVDFIPKEQWQCMVDSEVQKFKRETGPKIIRDLLQEEYKKYLKSEIELLTATTEWNELTQQYTSSKLTELIAASGGEIFAAVLQPAMSQVMQDLRGRLNGY